jgi:O-6-methylguanine DNA methyltransferase
MGSRSPDEQDEPSPRGDPEAIVAASIDAAWGPVHLAATGHGIVAIELMTTRDRFVAALERRLGRPVRWVEDAATPAPDDAAARNLRDGAAALIRALTGDDRNLGHLSLDLGDRPGWDRAVLGAVRTIPRGETRSYGEIARQIGTPGAARAVGGAVGRNPLALAIPCHRVIAGDGTLGGYGGGWWGDRERLLELKTELLAGEGRYVRRRPSEPGAGR